MLKAKAALARISAITEAWASMCPTKSFYGLTLDQFKEAVKPAYDARTEIADLDRRWTGAMAKRRDADAAALRIVQNVVRAVKADPEAGEDSPLYASMGYVRQSERSKGLTRSRGPQEVKNEQQTV